MGWEIGTKMSKNGQPHTHWPGINNLIEDSQSNTHTLPEKPTAFETQDRLVPGAVYGVALPSGGLYDHLSARPRLT